MELAPIDLGEVRDQACGNDALVPGQPGDRRHHSSFERWEGIVTLMNEVYGPLVTHEVRSTIAYVNCEM
jgi:hypothetical protein